MNRNATVMINKDSVVKTWLSEFKALSECDIPLYAKTINGNMLVINALHEVLGERGNELLEPMCHQLAQFCCAEQQELCLFTFQFLPELIWKHLSAVARQDKPSQSCVEGLLLQMYNLEVRSLDGDMMSSFVVPSLSQPSVYHEPCAFGSFGFTDYMIQKSKVKKLVYHREIHHHEWITAQNRFQVLTFLLQHYNMYITSMQQSSIGSFCKVFSRMSMSGLPRPDHRMGFRDKHPRINLAAMFMVQMLETVHYAIYNGEWDAGKRALEDILYRAKIELLFEPLLLGRAIRNALLWDAPHSLRKGSVCVSLDLNTTPRRASQTVVTSASIRGHRWKKEGFSMDDEIVLEDCTKPTTPQVESDFTSGLGTMELLTVSSSHAMNISQLELSSAQPLIDTTIDMTSELQYSHPIAVELALNSLLPSPVDVT
uniref:hyccin-like n=1 Tax=Myxine glutinosa TaxID=7769 RepID=UPI00358F917D